MSDASDAETRTNMPHMSLSWKPRRDVLQKVASEYVDFDTEEYLQSLPGGVVAAQYRKYSGRIDLGADDGTLGYRLAKETQEDIDSVDWINFVTAGAENWVIDQNPCSISTTRAPLEKLLLTTLKKRLCLFWMLPTEPQL
jgi:hypothetical protein